MSLIINYVQFLLVFLRLYGDINLD